LVFSHAVEALIQNISNYIHDPELRCLFANTLPNTLDTTVKQLGEHIGKDDTFIVTGDIDAMWLRDSTNQVQPYMNLLLRDKTLSKMVRGLINRQVIYMKMDPFANAFSEQINNSCSRSHHSKEDYTVYHPCVFERKFELDSLAAFLKLSSQYFQITKDVSIFDSEWRDAILLVLRLLLQNQRATGTSCSQSKGCDGYYFRRMTAQPTDSLSHGIGSPGRYTGMVRTAFRPSDDAAMYPFNVPANAMLVAELKNIIALLKVLHFVDINAWETLMCQVDHGIHQHGIKVIDDKSVFVYEVDGFGNYIFMDDGNIPSLLSLPYIGYVDMNNETYTNTRARLLNEETNPYYFKGSAGKGIGSPHTGPGNIWPMSLIVQALTTDNPFEITELLGMIVRSSKNTLHESFSKNDVSIYSRPWFAWCNSLFGELIVSIANTSPEILLKFSSFQHLEVEFN